MKRSRTFRVVVGFVLAFSVWVAWWYYRSPLPPLGNVVSIEVRLLPDQTQVPVPAELWQELYDGILPARRDLHPQKWAGLAGLRIKTRNGETIEGAVFYLPDEVPGAFTISDSYYRGGSTAKLERVLAEVKSAASPKATKN